MVGPSQKQGPWGLGSRGPSVGEATVTMSFLFHAPFVGSFRPDRSLCAADRPVFVWAAA